MHASEELLKDVIYFHVHPFQPIFSDCLIEVKSQFVLKLLLTIDSVYRIKMTVCLIVSNKTNILQRALLKLLTLVKSLIKLIYLWKENLITMKQMFKMLVINLRTLCFKQLQKVL